MRSKGNILKSLIVVGVLAGLAGTAPVASAGKANPGVLPPQSSPHGASYGEWAARWAQWALSLPATSHPLFDTADVDEGQEEGKVLFLGGRFCASPLPPGTECDSNQIERSITIPAGTALFFPLVNTADTLIEEESGYVCGGATEEGLRECVTWMIDHVGGLFCEIDGRVVSNLDKFRVQSPFFEFTLASHDNMLAAIGETAVPDGATSQGVAEGYYVMLPPLSVGEHTLHFGGAFDFPGFYFPLDITYHVTVAPGRGVK